MEENTDSDADFEKVILGLMINKDREIVINSHPDPVFMISNPEGSALLVCENSLLVFSNEEKIRHYMRDRDESSYVIREFAWDDLVSAFGGGSRDAIIDYNDEDGFYRSIPLRICA